MATANLTITSNGLQTFVSGDVPDAFAREMTARVFDLLQERTAADAEPAS